MQGEFTILRLAPEGARALHFTAPPARQHFGERPAPVSALLRSRRGRSADAAASRNRDLDLAAHELKQRVQLA